MRVPVEGSPICERCGLKVVSRELARQGVIMRFCDDCEWGVVAEEAAPSAEGVAQEAPAGARKTA